VQVDGALLEESSLQMSVPVAVAVAAAAQQRAQENLREELWLLESHSAGIRSSSAPGRRELFTSILRTGTCANLVVSAQPANHALYLNHRACHANMGPSLPPEVQLDLPRDPFMWSNKLTRDRIVRLETRMKDSFDGFTRNALGVLLTILLVGILIVPCERYGEETFVVPGPALICRLHQLLAFWVSRHARPIRCNKLTPGRPLLLMMNRLS
jgi:hypothetical protein